MASYSKLNPELVVANAKEAIAWYGTVFDAKCEFEYQSEKDQRMMHSLLRLPNDATFFVVDDFPEHNGDKSKVRRQEDVVTNNIAITITVPDGASVFKKAIEHGARVTMPFEKQFWGAVYGRFSDPFGHEWAIDQKAEEEKAAE